MRKGKSDWFTLRSKPYTELVKMVGAVCEGEAVIATRFETVKILSIAAEHTE
ncbi:MAG: hypothetical protein ACLQF0_06795 [Dissulfurispiraceae bacterium]